MFNVKVADMQHTPNSLKQLEIKSKYSEVEENMFKLKQDGKMDTPEYRELITQKAKLEKPTRAIRK
jgi:hypothetical protein